MHEVRDARALIFLGGPWAVFSLWAFTVSWQLLMDFEQRRDEIGLVFKGSVCVCACARARAQAFARAEAGA